MSECVAMLAKDGRIIKLLDDDEGGGQLKLLDDEGRRRLFHEMAEDAPVGALARRIVAMQDDAGQVKTLNQQEAFELARKILRGPKVKRSRQHVQRQPDGSYTVITTTEQAE